MNKAIDYYLRSIKAPTLCEWADLYSRMVWHRIHFARTVARMKVFETTITQNLIFDLASHNFPNISILESVNESANGDDLEIVKKVGAKYRKFAVQCKIAYKDEVFRAIDHQVKSRSANTLSYQIDLLCDYAQANGCIPLYFMYNYRKTHTSVNEQYGISVLGARYLKRIYMPSGSFTKKPSVDDMTSGASISFFDFLCTSAGLTSPGEQSELAQELLHRGEFPFEQGDNETYTDFELSEIVADPLWKPIEELDGRGISDRPKSERYKMFEPKYRFVIE